MSIQIIIDRMFHMDFLDHLEIIHLRSRLHIVKRKEQTEYVMKQAKAIVSSITQVGMDDHEK